MKLSVFIVLVFFIAGCTMIAFNKGDVSISETDSHDAGTNGRSFDVNISPK